MSIRLGAVLGVCAAGEITNVTQPFQPAGRFWLAKFPIAFEIEITLPFGGQGNDEFELRPGARHLRLEAAHAIAAAVRSAEQMPNMLISRAEPSRTEHA